MKPGWSTYLRLTFGTKDRPYHEKLMRAANTYVYKIQPLYKIIAIIRRHI